MNPFLNRFNATEHGSEPVIANEHTNPYPAGGGTDLRDARAVSIAVNGGITSLGSGVFNVPSQSTAGACYQCEYHTDDSRISCSCKDWHARRKQRCKHGRALVRAVAAAGCDDLLSVPIGFVLPPISVPGEMSTATMMYKDGQRRPPVVIDFPSGPRERTRRFHAYQAMSTRIPHLLNKLLEPYIEERSPKQGGQKMLRHDRLFAILFRTFLNKPLVDTSRELERLAKLGRIEWGPKPNAICEFVHDGDLTPILEECLARTAMPMRYLENIVCIDSSGFSTCWSGNYLDNDRGARERRSGQWLKAHVISGATTNVVAAMILTWNKRGIAQDDAKELTADTNFMIPLIKKMLSLSWRPEYAAADKAYLSDKNVDEAAQEGVRAVIQMKRNSKRDGKTRKDGKTKAWVELWDFFTDHPGAHEEIYRFRGKIESVFSALKRTCGHYTWARGARLPKNPQESDFFKISAARRNEMLAKMIVHNLRQTVMLEFLHDEVVDYTIPAADPEPGARAETWAFTPIPDEWKRIAEIRDQAEEESPFLDDDEEMTGT